MQSSDCCTIHNKYFTLIHFPKIIKSIVAEKHCIKRLMMTKWEWSQIDHYQKMQNFTLLLKMSANYYFNVSYSSRTKKFEFRGKFFNSKVGDMSQIELRHWLWFKFILCELYNQLIVIFYLKSLWNLVIVKFSWDSPADEVRAKIVDFLPRAKLGIMIIGYLGESNCSKPPKMLKIIMIIIM